MGMQWAPQFTGNIGQYLHTIDMGGSNKKQEAVEHKHYATSGCGYTYNANAAAGYGPPPYHPPQPPAGWWEDTGAYDRNPSRKPSGYHPAPQPTGGWENGGQYNEYTQKPPGYGGDGGGYPARQPAGWVGNGPPPQESYHPRPVNWDDQQRPPFQELNKKAESKPPGQEAPPPPPNANQESKDMPPSQPSPKRETSRPPVAADPPRTQPPSGTLTTKVGVIRPATMVVVVVVVVAAAAAAAILLHRGGATHHPVCLRRTKEEEEVIIIRGAEAMVVVGRPWVGRHQHLLPELMLPMEHTTSTRAAMAVAVTAMARTPWDTRASLSSMLTTKANSSNKHSMIY